MDCKIKRKRKENKKKKKNSKSPTSLYAAIFVYVLKLFFQSISRVFTLFKLNSFGIPFYFV